MNSTQQLKMELCLARFNLSRVAEFVESCGMSSMFVDNIPISEAVEGHCRQLLLHVFENKLTASDSCGFTAQYQSEKDEFWLSWTPVLVSSEIKADNKTEPGSDSNGDDGDTNPNQNELLPYSTLLGLLKAMAFHQGGEIVITKEIIQDYNRHGFRHVRFKTDGDNYYFSLDMEDENGDSTEHDSSD